MTRGCSTGRRRNRSTSSGRTWACRRAGSQRRSRPQTGRSSPGGSRTTRSSCGSTPARSRTCSEAQRSAWARSTPCAPSGGSSAAARSCTSVPQRSSPTRVTCPPTATGSSSTARPGAPRRPGGRVRAGPDHAPVRHDRVRPWSAATVGAIEARHGDDVDRNRLCPPVVFTGDVADILELSYSGDGLVARSSDAAVNEWTESSRLNPAKGAAPRRPASRRRSTPSSAASARP